MKHNTRYLYGIRLIAIIASFTLTQATAQTFDPRPLEQQVDTGELPPEPETAGTSETDDLSWRSTDGDDLATTQSERRSAHQHMIGLFIGENSPWSIVGFRYSRMLSPRAYAGAMLGLGRFSRLANTNGDFDLTADVTSVGGRTFWWFSEEFPLGVLGDLSLHHIAQKTKCTSNASTCRNASAARFGASAGVSLALTWLLSESLVVDWTIVGIKTMTLQKASSRFHHDAKTASDRMFTERRIINFANLGLGYFF